MKSLAVILSLIVVIITSCGTLPTEETEVTEANCEECGAPLTIIFDHDTWQPGEYGFRVDLLDINVTYFCMIGFPNVFAEPTFSSQCPAEEIQTTIKYEGDTFFPTGLVIYRSDFSSLYFMADHIDENRANSQTLIHSFEVLPSWEEDDCECKATEDVTISF